MVMQLDLCLVGNSKDKFSRTLLGISKWESQRALSEKVAVPYKDFDKFLGKTGDPVHQLSPWTANQQLVRTLDFFVTRLIQYCESSETTELVSFKVFYVFFNFHNPRQY